MKPFTVPVFLSACALVAGALIMPNAGAEPRPGGKSARGAVRTGGASQAAGRAVRAVSRDTTARTSRAAGVAAGRSVRGEGRGSTANRNGRTSPGRNSRYNNNDLGSALAPLLGASSLNGLQSGYGSGYGLLDELYRGGDYYRDIEQERAKAYREAAMINGLVGIAGMLIQSSQPQQYLVQSAPVPVAIGPAQTVYVAPPAPRYAQEKVLVREGYEEDIQVWVPETYDPNTGITTVGHNVTQRRWVAPVFENREVRVQ